MRGYRTGGKDCSFKLPALLTRGERDPSLPRRRRQALMPARQRPAGPHAPPRAVGQPAAAARGRVHRRERSSRERPHASTLSCSAGKARQVRSHCPLSSLAVWRVCHCRRRPPLPSLGIRAALRRVAAAASACACARVWVLCFFWVLWRIVLPILLPSCCGCYWCAFPEARFWDGKTNALSRKTEKANPFSRNGNIVLTTDCDGLVSDVESDAIRGQKG